MYKPDCNERFKFLSYIDYLKLDTSSNKSLFGEEGYITGLYKIFNNDSDFNLEIKKNLNV